MAFVNYSTREINVKIVYYGPGLCGKTANLQYLYSRAPNQARGRLISLATETERTLFFDFLPMNLGKLHGFKVRFHLYTVPGQVFYEASRKLILKGVDGLLFVADSDPLRLDANQESWEGLHRNLAGYGLAVPPLPAVIQYNKRDLPNALPVDELREALGSPDLPQFESVATSGEGVFESLKGLAKGVLNQLQHETIRTDRTGFVPEQVAAVAAAPPSGTGMDECLRSSAADPRPAAGVQGPAPLVAPSAPGGRIPAPRAAAAGGPAAGPVADAAATQAGDAQQVVPPRQAPGAPGPAAQEKPREPAPVVADRSPSAPATAPPRSSPAPTAPACERPTGGGLAAGRPPGDRSEGGVSPSSAPAAPSAPSRSPGGPSEPQKRRGFGWFRRTR